MGPLNSFSCTVNQTNGCVPVSNILPELGHRFDISLPLEYIQRFDSLQSGDPPSTWKFRTSNGETISLFHDAPLLGRRTVECAQYLFTEGVNGFRDQIVVDLGAGHGTDGYLVARDFGARAYIAVEFCFAAPLHANLTGLLANEKTIPFAVVYDAIEEVLPALPVSSVSFLCAGLDDTFPNFQKLLKIFSKEVPSKLHPHGACLLQSPVHERFIFPGLRNVSTLPSLPVFVR